MKKRFLAIFLAISMLFSLCPAMSFSVFAVDSADDKQVEAASEPTYPVIDGTDSYTNYGIAVSSLNQARMTASSEGSEQNENDVSCRVLMRAESEMNFNAYDPDLVVAGPEYHYTLQFSSAEEAAEAVADLQKDSKVVYAQQDRIVSLDPIETEPVSETETTLSAASTSSGITHNSWGCAALNVDSYIDYSTSWDNENSVIVAVIDTGVDYTHTFLKDRMVYNADGSIAGYDYVDNDSDPMDENNLNSSGTITNTYHGTHCAGIVADCTQKLNVQILAMRVLDDSGSGSTSNVAFAVQYAWEHGAKVISLSLGGEGCDPELDNAINTAISNGTTVCVSAGNSGYSLDTTKNCPAHIENAITVGALAQSGSAYTRASYSNYGSAVDVCAPGSSIKSCKGGSTNAYQSMNGTSMATPHVAACAAMLLLENPNLTASEVSDTLKASGTDLGTAGRDDYYGDGLPQMNYTVSNVLSTEPESGTTTSQPFSSGTGGSTYFRIPAMVTLNNGTLVAAADARWNSTGDGGGNDTLVSYSTDSGATWNYSFANYLGDNGNVHNGASTCFIDPALATDGSTVYMLADLWPAGYALNSANNTPVAGANGFDENGNLRLSGDNRSSYGYYLNLSDYKIYSSSGTQVTGLVVDEKFNVTGTYNGTTVSTNLFCADSPFLVYPTNYLYLTQSTDGGATWKSPTLINVKKAAEQSCLVGPGTGCVTSTGRILYTVYNYTNGDKNTSVIYSDDQGKTWTRSADLSATSSEGTLTEVQLGSTSYLYLFTRHGGYYVSTDNGTTWSDCKTVSGISYNTGCELNVMTYSQTIDGRPAILLSAPGSTASRTDGKIFVGLIQKDGSIQWKYTYSVNSGIYQYSCLTELTDGSIGLLYEDGDASITYTNLPITTIANGAVIGGEVVDPLSLEDLYVTSTVTKRLDESTFQTMLMLDAGRKYFSVEHIETILDEMAKKGYTALMLGLGNDGLRFLLDDMSVSMGSTTYSSDAVTAAIQAGNKTYSDQTLSGETANELTEADMDAIFAYAQEKGIEIIPLINTPGHMDAVLSAATSLTGTDCSYYSSARTINVTNVNAVAFTQALVTKYIQYFAEKGCKAFNLGADEYANDLSSSSSYYGFAGLQSTGNYSYYIQYVNSIAAIIKNNGMVPMAFNDGIYYNNVTTSGTFDQDIAICYWSNGWSGYYPMSSANLAAKGHQIINFNSNWYYVLGNTGSTTGWSTYEHAANDTKTVSVTTVVDGGATPIGAAMAIWCDYPSRQYTTEEQTKILTLVDNLADSNSAYFTPKAEEKDITLFAGESVTLTDDSGNYESTALEGLDTNVATASLKGTTTPGKSTTVFTKIASTDVVSGSAYYISDGSGNYLTLSGTTVGNTTNKSSATKFTATSSSSGYTLKSGSYYLYYGSSSTVKGSTSSYSWTYSDSGLHPASARTAGRYLNYSSSWTTVTTGSGNAALYADVTTTEPSTYQTDITFTGIKAGTTAVTIGNTKYKLTVKALPEAVTYENTVFTSGSSLTGASGQKVGKLETSVGLSYDLNSTVSGGTWKVLDTSVATVNENGTVTGVQAGETTIIYSTDDADYAMPLVVRNDAGTAASTKTYEFYIADNANTTTYMAICNGTFDKLEAVAQGEAIYLSFASNANTAIDFFSMSEYDYLLTGMGEGTFYALEADSSPEDTDFYQSTVGSAQISALGATTVQRMIQEAMVACDTDQYSCEGAIGYTSSASETTSIQKIVSFAADPLPEATIEISKINDTAYTEGMTASVGDEITYTVTVTKHASTHPIQYTNGTLASTAEEGGAVFSDNQSSIEITDLFADQTAKEQSYSMTYTVAASDAGTEFENEISFSCDYEPANCEALGGLFESLISASVEVSNVAKIGDTEYKTLAEALKAATSGQTVKLLNDIPNEYSSSDLSVKNITLDLNGHSLTADYVVVFGGSIIDSTTYEGSLIVEKDHLAYQGKDVTYLPIYDSTNGAYKFVKIGLGAAWTKGNTTNTVWFGLTSAMTKDIYSMLKQDRSIEIGFSLTYQTTTTEGTSTKKSVLNFAADPEILSSYLENRIGGGTNYLYATFAKTDGITLKSVQPYIKSGNTTTYLAGSGLDY